jgi:hypothetical protein
VSDTFEIQLKRFLQDNEVCTSDFEKLFDYLKTKMGALSMDDLVELNSDDLQDERAGY